VDASSLKLEAAKRKFLLDFHARQVRLMKLKLKVPFFQQMAPAE
jgi:hypothetical protein